MNKLLAGKKTYIFLTVLALGVFGLGDIVSEDELGRGFDLALELIGLVGAVYGRAVAKPKPIE